MCRKKEDKIQLAETDRGSQYNQEELLEEFLDDKGAFYNGSESDDSDNDDENYNENIEESFADVLHNRCSQKFCKFHKKTFVLEFLFNKIRNCNFIKNRLQQVFSYKICELCGTPFLQNSSSCCL